MTVSFDRRSVVAALAAAGGLALTGCGRSPRDEDTPAAPPNAAPVTGVRAGPPLQAAAMTVYRDPSCGCCEAWAGLARNAGYAVTLVDHPDMVALKRQHGVPAALASCHTALIAGYAIEGHVPLEDVGHLLEKRPSSVLGIAVPGMPRGSPGMEMPDGARDSFQVMAFDAAGRSSPFRS